MKISIWSMLKSAILILSILAAVVSCQKNVKEEYILKASLWANEDHTWFKAFDYFSTVLAERSKGRLKLEVYPSEQLAKEIESIRLIQADVIDMTVTASLLSNWIEIATFCELPFLVRDSVEKSRIIKGPIGQRVEKEMLDRMGLRTVGVFERGPRQLTSNRPIRTPDDLQGMVIRVPNVPSFVTAWSALGAKPTPMAFSEVFTALQQGTVEAQENDFALILSAGFDEVQEYVNVTEHVMSWSYPIIGEKQFQRLPPDLQDIFLNAAADMQSYESSLFRKSEKKVMTNLQNRGMEFIEVDKDAFIKKCETAIYNSLSDEMQVLYQDFISMRNPEYPIQ